MGPPKFGCDPWFPPKVNVTQGTNSSWSSCIGWIRTTLDRRFTARSIGTRGQFILVSILARLFPEYLMGVSAGHTRISVHTTTEIGTFGLKPCGAAGLSLRIAPSVVGSLGSALGCSGGVRSRRGRQHAARSVRNECTASTCGPRDLSVALARILGGFARTPANGLAAVRKPDCLHGRSLDIFQLLKVALAGAPRLEVARVLGRCPRAAAPGPRLGAPQRCLAGSLAGPGLAWLRLLGFQSASRLGRPP